MSTDFIALFDISSEVVNLGWLLAKLVASPDFALDVVEEYRDHWQPKAWAIKTVPNEPRLYGPGGFAIGIKPGTLDLYHMMRFNTFTSDATSRNALRRACLWIAELVGSARAIYTHELMPFEGEGLDQIESGLRACIGPPALTFAELDAAEHFESHAWYVDNFADLRGEKRPVHG